MAWTAPMTAVASTAFASADFNLYVRDNLNELAPAKANALGSYFVAGGINNVAQRTVGSPLVIVTSSSETTTSTSFVDLDTPGPQIEVTSGVRAFVIVGGRLSNASANSAAAMGYAVSESSIVAATDRSARHISGSASAFISASLMVHHADFVAGTNTVVCKYAASAGTAQFNHRRLGVLPF